MKNIKIKKAVIPVAGFGTRFLPATKAQPKEMLPVVDKPVIQYIIEEMVASGITEIVLITGQNKRAIEDHFDSNFELEYRLAKDGKNEILEQIKNISSLAKFIYIRQKEALGNGHALLCAKEAIGDEPFVLAFGDDIIYSEIPAVAQMIPLFERFNKTVIGVVEVSNELTRKYGVIDGAMVGDNEYRVRNIVEKPAPEDAPSNLINPGRYILQPKIFEILETLGPGKNGEIWLADAIKQLIDLDEIYAKKLAGQYFDCGDKLEFLKATIHYGLLHEDTSSGFKQYLKNLDL